MSETDNDTSTLDQKKNEDTSSDISIEEYLKKGGSFFIYIIFFILFIGIYFSNGSLLIFLGKLAQSNILPTDKGCSPYTTQPTQFDNKTPINMDIYTTMDKTNPEVDPQKVSKKISFENNSYNSSSFFIDATREYKNNSSSNFLINYFISIVESLLQKDYSLLNSYMNLINAYFSETMLILFSPILFGLLFGCLIINDFLHLVYFWFAKMSWFFKTNTNNTGEGKPTWENITLMSPFSWFIGILLVFIFFIFFFVVISVLSPLIIVRVLYVIISALFYKGVLNDNKEVNSFTLILETIKQYKLAIVWIISIFIVLLAFSHIGIIPGLLAVVVVWLLYSKKISSDLFDPVNLNKHTPYEGMFKQMIKKCTPITQHNRTTKSNNGFLYNLFIGYLLNLFGLKKIKQNGGTDLKLRKNINYENIKPSLKKIYKLSKPIN